jgi:hypothetical protein
VTTEKKTEALAAEGRARVHARFGWTLLLVSLVFGAVLEGMEGFRWGPVVRDMWVQRLWSLAHFHGAAFGLLNLIYVPWADTRALSEGRRTSASRMLIVGSVTMPLGFLLGGIGHFEGDPSIGIFLAPLGAVFVLYTVVIHTLAVWRSPST